VLGWLVIEELLTQRGKRLPPPDPIGVLDHRFATGEIDEADWSRRRAALTYGPPLPLD
jgi:hypothetical protein